MADDDEQTGVRRTVKSETAFRTISEVAEDLDVPQHVLRFWESKFPQVKPLKRGGGRRYYRPEDISLLRRIRDLLYSEGYTIKGVQKLLREGGARELPLRQEPELGLLPVAKSPVSSLVSVPPPVPVSIQPALPDGETDEDEFMPDIQDVGDDLRPQMMIPAPEDDEEEADDLADVQAEPEQEYVVNQRVAEAVRADVALAATSSSTIESTLGSLAPLADLLSHNHADLPPDVKDELREILSELEQIRNLLQPR